MRFLKQKLPGGIQIDLQFSCLMQKFFEIASLLHHSQHQIVLDFSVKEAEMFLALRQMIELLSLDQ